jgi:hypothetical protein
MAVTEVFSSELPDGYIDVPLLTDERMVRQQAACYLVYEKPIWPGQLALTNQRLLFRPLDLTATSKMTRDGICFLPDDLAVLGTVVGGALDYAAVYEEGSARVIHPPTISGVRPGMGASLLHPPSLVLTFADGSTMDIGIVKGMGSANFWHANNTARDEVVEEISAQLVANGVGQTGSSEK